MRNYISKIKNFTLYKSTKYWKEDLKYWEVIILWQNDLMKQVENLEHQGSSSIRIGTEKGESSRSQN